MMRRLHVWLAKLIAEAGRDRRGEARLRVAIEDAQRKQGKEVQW